MLLSNTTGTEALEKGMKDAIEFGPFLIVNGTPLEIVGDPWGRSPRVAIAQRRDGVVLFLVIDGENYVNGATLQDTALSKNSFSTLRSLTSTRRSSV